MKPVAILRHGPTVPAGRLGEVLADRGVAVTEVPLFAGAMLPDLDTVSAAVSLGGFQGAYDAPTYPYLDAEKRWLAAATWAGLPVLGICLGSQLLADALGGRAYLASHPEVAVTTVDLTAAGRNDGVVSKLDGPVLVWHQDTWDPPPGAEVLAETKQYPQAFRLGSALGIQPHPEATGPIVEGWLADGGSAWLEKRGFDPGDVRTAMAEREEQCDAIGRALFGAWADEALS